MKIQIMLLATLAIAMSFINIASAETCYSELGMNISYSVCPGEISFSPLCELPDNTFIAAINSKDTAYIGEQVTVNITLMNNDTLNHTFYDVRFGSGYILTVYEGSPNEDLSINASQVIHDTSGILYLMPATNDNKFIFDEGSDCDLNFSTKCIIKPQETVTYSLKWTVTEGNLTQRIWRSSDYNSFIEGFGYNQGCVLNHDEKNISVNGTQSAQGDCPIYLHAYDTTDSGIHIGFNEGAIDSVDLIDGIYYSGLDSHPQIIRNMKPDIQLYYMVQGRDYGTFSFTGTTSEDNRNIIIETEDLPINPDVTYEFKMSRQTLYVTINKDGNLIENAQFSAESNDIIKPTLISISNPIDTINPIPIITKNIFDYNLFRDTDFRIWKFRLDINSFSTLNSDEDNDGVIDMHDKCPNTTHDTPEQELKHSHHAVYEIDNELNWKTNSGAPASPQITDSAYTLGDTYGCSCEQILYCKPGANTGEYKWGCSEGTMSVWTGQTGWSRDCQTGGIVAIEGEAKAMLENTDDNGLIDAIDTDNDNDGISDNEDAMIDDADPPGSPGYGIPDWWENKHPRE